MKRERERDKRVASLDMEMRLKIHASTRPSIKTAEYTNLYSKPQ